MNGTLIEVEERLLDHLRRLLKQNRDFKIEVFGSFKAGKRVVELRPCGYERFETKELESAFYAID